MFDSKRKKASTDVHYDAVQSSNRCYNKPSDFMDKVRGLVNLNEIEFAIIYQSSALQKAIHEEKQPVLNRSSLFETGCRDML